MSEIVHLPPLISAEVEPSHLPGHTVVRIGLTCTGPRTADLRRFCEDVLRVIDRREKEERDMERLAKRLYETEYGNMSINGQPIHWANLDDSRKEHYRGFARRFRGAK